MARGMLRGEGVQAGIGILTGLLTVAMIYLAATMLAGSPPSVQTISNTSLAILPEISPDPIRSTRAVARTSGSSPLQEAATMALWYA